ncbi:hypothetical protein HY251_06045, partial [bacterium]|nr:hypothetical protein [bacterium]
LAKAAWTPVSVGASASEPRAALPPAEELSSRGFYEVKELAQRVRGPLARRIALAQGSVDIEVPAADSRAALVCFMEKASAAASEIARLGKEAGATRAVAGGGLLELAPFRAALEKAIPGLVSLEAPLFAASRGALRSLEASPVPRTAASLRLVARSGPGVVAREVVPAGASLPGRFGPVSLEVSAPQDPLELSVLEGEVLKTATFPRRPPRTTFQVDIEWTYEHAWRVLPRDQTPPAPLVAQSEERAKPLRDALSFDFSSHAEAAPVDALFLFVATQGEGPLLGVAADGILALAKRLAERAKAARVGAIAIGDHPQGAVRPRYATLAHPFGDAAALEKFVRDQQKSPVDGIDAPEALECGLAKAAESAWRADAEKAVFVITDVPPHEKGEPPFCNVDWREGAKKLRSQGATVVSVFLEGGALAPDIAKRTRAFLEEIRSPSEPVVGLRGKPGDALLAAVDRLAAQKRLSGAAQSVLARVAVGLTGA